MNVKRLNVNVLLLYNLYANETRSIEPIEKFQIELIIYIYKFIFSTY